MTARDEYGSRPGAPVSTNMADCKCSITDYVIMCFQSRGDEDDLLAKVFLLEILNLNRPFKSEST